jgi:periplasmic divalent cation tolerance protein
MSNELVVFVTAPDADHARLIAKELVSQRVAACVNIIPTVESIYTWNGQTEVSAEALMVIKTTDFCYQRLEECVKALHQYTTPEVVALRIDRGLPAYLSWIRETTIRDTTQHDSTQHSPTFGSS